LHAQLERTAERLDFEKAARVRNRIDRVSELSQSQDVLSRAVNQGDLAIVLPAVDPECREIMLVRFGRTWSRRVFHMEEPSGSVISDLDRSWNRARHLASSTILQRELDSVQILNRWVRKYWDHPSIIPLPDGPIDWDDIVETARTIEIIE
jgi:excinuclease UvrABC nuclease subunit